MLPSLLITLREGLEAALIVGIILSVLNRVNQQSLRKYIWSGVVVAVVASVLAGAILMALGIAFEGRAEELFEGIATLTAAGVLTWMIFWMQQQGHRIQKELEDGVKQALTGGSVGALFGLAFVAVVREGIETALFLSAAMFSSTPGQVLVGGVLGLGIAIILGWLLFSAGMQLNLRMFFRVTSLLLLLFAAGLVAYGIHELQEAGAFPIIIEHVYDINHILNEKETAGLFLKALFGYNGNPSLLEVIAYTLYMIVITTITWLTNRRERQSLASQVSS